MQAIWIALIIFNMIVLGLNVIYNNHGIMVLFIFIPLAAVIISVAGLFRIKRRGG